MANQRKNHRPALVIEDIWHSPRMRLFNLFGVPVDITPLGWLNPILIFAGSMALTFFLFPDLMPVDRLGLILAWTVVGVATLFTHSIGHIISGKIAGAPMDSLLITMTRQVNIYEGDQSHYPARVHILRAVGGGVANITAGLVGLILIALVGGSPVWWLWVAAQVGAGLVSYAPVDSVDGGTILHHWRELKR